MIRETPSVPSTEDLIALIAALKAENASLRARMAELERRLGLNSSNSGKPPSSDGLKKPARVTSLRESSGKKPGGQKGHKGETLRQVADPDEVVDHYPSACSGCGAGLDPDTSVGHSTRQVFDLPEPRPLVVTEHRAHDCRCAACGAETRAPFPDGVNAPVQYGPRIGAFVLYLLHYQLLPEKRLVELMADLLGVKLVTATIARISQDCARRFQVFADVVRDHIAAAPVKHMDETGFRIGGRTQWLHIASTALLTFYRVCAKRGSLLVNVAGIVVHDHWKPYYTMPGVLHALCNAHHLRELKALVEIEKEDWARKMQRLLRRACHAANLARERGVPLKPSLIVLIERRYDAILVEGLTFHEAQAPLAQPVKGGRKRRGRVPRRTGHNLLLRLVTRKQDTLRFLHDPTVPFTNNQAERDGRMMKLRQKISGGFRSAEGAMDFALIRSFFSTAKKQGWNIIDALTCDPSNLAKSLRLS
jgi:transposase